MLAVSGDPGRRPLAGKETREPAFGVPAIWIAPALEDQAIAAGYSVVDAVTVITTHLGELIRQHAWELLGRAETKRLLDSLERQPSQADGRAGAQAADAGRGGPGARAVAARAGLDPRPGRDSRGAARDRAGEQEPGGPGRSRAAGAGTAAGSAAARRRGPVAGAAARSGARRRDSRHAFARDRPAPAGRQAAPGNPGACAA